MSLVANYHKLQLDLQKLTAEHDKLAQDPELKREMEFDSKIRSLMGQYGKSLRDVISILDPAPPGASVEKGNKRRPRTVKVYHNPLTGETVETKGGNNKLLGQWKAQFGAEEVASWVK